MIPIRLSLSMLLAAACSVGLPAYAVGEKEDPNARSNDPRSNFDRRRDDSGGGTPANGGRAGDPPGGGGAEGRRNNRLSPEERRALRRQIDEAGNDIYRRKR